MSQTAQIISENGHQTIRLPGNVRLSGAEVDIRQDERSGQITLTPRDERTEEERQRHWDSLSKMAAEVPQEEWDLFDAAIKAGRTWPKCGV